MIVFRLCPLKYAYELTGAGTIQYGGRWNTKGIKLIYTSSTISLSLCEKLVHIDKIPEKYSVVSYNIPGEEHSLVMKIESLPADWSSYPYHLSTIQLGDAFIKENKHLVMQVPSAIIHTEFNYLINANHKGFSKVKIVDVVPFSFDRRLVK